MLRGELVNLRAVERADLETIWTWMNAPDLMRFWGVPASSPSRDAVRSRIEGWLDGESRLERPVALVIETLEGEPVGLAIAAEGEAAARDVELSLFIAQPSHRGRGFGSDAIETLLDAAFEQWGMHRVALRVEAFNSEALRFYERLGFVQEGRLRDATYCDGAFHDVLMLSLLSSDARGDDA
jgi:RimJ/RimL family protein N-acetyltransferase